MVFCVLTFFNFGGGGGVLVVFTVDVNPKWNVTMCCSLRQGKDYGADFPRTL
jgi:hypothetical protein